MQPKYKRLSMECLKYVPLGFLAALILINFYLGINKAVTGNPLPKAFGFSPLIVLSGSMKPAIHAGDVIVIREQPAGGYKVGDVATYLVGATAFTHRIVSEENGVFTLKGDNNNAADDAVTADRFEGKMLLRIPKIGLAIVFFKKPASMALLGLMIILGFYGGKIYQKARFKLQKRVGHV
ncbi:MAG: signal peptidase I [Desulfotomaculaceae bacterium]|nr:signal peptidase I [Desulfotomaculaceae bacterium]